VTFADFMGLYVAASSVLVGPDEFFRLFREIAEDAAAAGAVWVEVHVDSGLHAPRLGSDDDVFEIVLAGAAAAEAATGVGIGLVVSADRCRDPANAVEQAHRAARHAGPQVVAFGLANDEAFAPEPFADAFAIARDAGLLSVPHAGELVGPVSVRGALDTLAPDRLGHGVRSVEDPALVRRLADEGICCDVCPTSNLKLSFYPSIEAHPIATLIEAGVPVTLNGDDPLMFDSPLAGEYQLVCDAFGYGDDVMASIARTSIERSAMPADRKHSALTAIDTWLTW
jgi:adenosine deaminase